MPKVEGQCLRRHRQSKGEVMPTRQQIDALKQGWLQDPCFDLTELAMSPEYLLFAKELIDFQREAEARWKAEREARLMELAERYGCPGNLTLAGTIERLTNRVAELESKLRND